MGYTVVNRIAKILMDLKDNFHILPECMKENIYKITKRTITHTEIWNTPPLSWRAKKKLYARSTENPQIFGKSTHRLIFFNSDFDVPLPTKI